MLRYGTVIGYALKEIPRGSWVREELLSIPEAPGLDRLHNDLTLFNPAPIT
ncbi:Galactarate dehydratase (L-threo-forming) [compost metagenome]